MKKLPNLRQTRTGANYFSGLRQIFVNEVKPIKKLWYKVLLRFFRENEALLMTASKILEV